MVFAGASIGAADAQQRKGGTMATQVDLKEREAIVVEDAQVRSVMTVDVLEPLPSRRIPYRIVDPYILVHEAVVRISPEQASFDTKHQHRGFDNLWYAVSGSSSTGHSTGPVAPWSGLGWSPDLSSSSEPVAGSGMQRGSVGTSSRRAWPGRRCAVCSSG
jgi:hypothetical protein